MDEGTPGGPLADYDLFHLRIPGHTVVCCHRKLRTREVPG